jgi:hypothetical protein
MAETYNISRLSKQSTISNMSTTQVCEHSLKHNKENKHIPSGGQHSSLIGGQSDQNMGRKIELKIRLEEKTETFQVASNNTIMELKEMIKKRFIFTNTTFSLISHSQYFRDQLFIHDYQITQSTPLQVIFGLQGGSKSTSDTTSTISSKSQQPISGDRDRQSISEEESDEDISKMTKEQMKEYIKTLRRLASDSETDVNTRIKEATQSGYRAGQAIYQVAQIQTPTQAYRTPKAPFHRTSRDDDDQHQSPVANSSPYASRKSPSPTDFINNALPTTITNYFNIEIEVANLVGTVAERRLASDKPAKDIKLDRVPTFHKSMQFVEWWRKFTFEINARGYERQYKQIKYCFLSLMDDEIREIIAFLSHQKQLELEELVQVVLSQFEVKPKTIDEYIVEFFTVSKEIKETVTAYYLRFLTLAMEAGIDDPTIRARRYLAGLQPNALYADVLQNMDTSGATVEQLHQCALRMENNYLCLQMRRHEKREDKTNQTQPKAQIRSDYSPKEDKSKKSSTFTTNTKFQKKEYPKNLSNKPRSNDPQSPSSNNNKTISGICRYCEKEHDYRECQLKFKNYTFEEAKLLRQMGREPLPRPDKIEMKDRLTSETQWVKNTIERQKSNPSGQSKTNQQFTAKKV